MPPLKNPKHDGVLQHYIKSSDRVGWKSYASVYPKSSQRAAEVGWSRLLKNAEFAARKTELEQAVTEVAVAQSGITVGRVLEELARIGFANMKDFAVVFPDGDISTIDREHASAIQELVVDTYMDGGGDDAREVKRVRFKLGDKRAALVDIGRHLGMFKDRVEHTGKDGGAIEHADVTDTTNELEVLRRIAFALELGRRKVLGAPSEKPKTKGQ